MPVPATLEELLDFEAQFHAALDSILAPFASGPHALQIVTAELPDTLRSPRLEADFELGQGIGPRQSVQCARRGSASLCLAYQFTLTFALVYDRTKLDLTASGLRGQLRQLLAPESDAFNAAPLPWLNIDALGETRAVQRKLAGSESDKALDVWMTTWQGQFSILTTALPPLA